MINDGTANEEANKLGAVLQDDAETKMAESYVCVSCALANVSKRKPAQTIAKELRSGQSLAKA